MVTALPVSPTLPTASPASSTSRQSPTKRPLTLAEAPAFVALGNDGSMHGSVTGVGWAYDQAQENGQAAASPSSSAQADPNLGPRVLRTKLSSSPPTSSQTHSLPSASPNHGATTNDPRSAVEQSRALFLLPAALHAQLARMCSQHYLSDYNALKRVNSLGGQSASAGPNVEGQVGGSEPSQTSAQPGGMMRSWSSPAAPTLASTSPGGTGRPALPARTLSTSAALNSMPAALRGSERIPTANCASFLGSDTLDAPMPTSSSLSNAVVAPVEVQAILSAPSNANMVSSSPPAEQVTSPAIAQLASAASFPAASNAIPTLPHEAEPVPDIANIIDEPAAPPPPSAQAMQHSQPVLLPGMRVINGIACKTSESHPMNISTLVPPEHLALVAESLGLHGSSSAASTYLSIANGSPGKSPLTPSLSAATNAHPSSIPSSHSSVNPQNGSSSISFRLATPTDTGDLHTTLSRPSPDPLSVATSLAAAFNPAPPLGNFMLSSCPGKKVRMALVGAEAVSLPAGGGAPGGNAGGRSAICRDVVLDLGRAKGLGVGVVICCLDDQELSYLGAPWPDYARAAHHHSLHVIRIPMQEGFAPASPAFLDAQLDRVVRLHTLRGESVLAHCRGGIGRAGLVACCWMLKMGLVDVGSGSGHAGGSACFEPMEVVERVIEVIRKRRSVKSIETPVQVAFLLAYVTYLQQHATVVKAHELV